jgi:hypothetical protein
MKLYGLRGFYHHGFEKVLTVMSPEGVTAALAYVKPPPDVTTKAAPGRLTQYIEQSAGALDRLAARYDIAILGKSEWDRIKNRLGDSALR